MKKLFFALALLILSTGGVFAASCNRDTDKWSNDQWCISSADTLIPSTSASQQVVTENYTTANTNNLLAASESGKRLSDTGGAATGSSGFGSKHILPRASAGLSYTITAATKSFVTVDTLDTQDTIRYSISGTALAAGESIKSTGQAGDSVTLYSPAANVWDIQDMKAAWTNNSTN